MAGLPMPIFGVNGMKVDEGTLLMACPKTAWVWAWSWSWDAPCPTEAKPSGCLNGGCCNDVLSSTSELSLAKHRSPPSIVMSISCVRLSGIMSRCCTITSISSWLWTPGVVLAALTSGSTVTPWAIVEGSSMKETSIGSSSWEVQAGVGSLVGDRLVFAPPGRVCCHPHSGRRFLWVQLTSLEAPLFQGMTQAAGLRTSLELNPVSARAALNLQDLLSPEETQLQEAEKHSKWLLKDVQKYTGIFHCRSEGKIWP